MTIHSTLTCTAFEGVRRLASGPLRDVAAAVKHAHDRAGGASGGGPDGDPILVFDDATSRPVEFDLRGSVDDVLARLADDGASAGSDAAGAPGLDGEPAVRGRGRPKLGVVAREVTLLPRHWEWLNAQPGGASVALRKLVDDARRANGERDRQRAARDAAYHFMSAMAGTLPNFEEASRALFADDRRRFVGHIANWPDDIRDHVVKLAYQ